MGMNTLVCTVADRGYMAYFDACVLAEEDIYCGDGDLDANEQCDLGDLNGVTGSGCTKDCRIEITPVVPEFGAVIGILTLVGALGVFFVVRRR
jgi:cysteine-rich repeat protein